MSDAAAIAAGWFLDPEDPTNYRWWDGATWTEHRSPVEQAAATVAAVPAVAALPQAQAAPALSVVPTHEAATTVPAATAEQATPATKPARSARSLPLIDVMPRTIAIGALGVVVLLVAVWFLFLRGGNDNPTVDPSTLPPATQPSDPGVDPNAAAAAASTPATAGATKTTADAGGAVPTAVDHATGGGVTKAKDIAAAQTAANAANDQAVDAAS